MAAKSWFKQSAPHLVARFESPSPERISRLAKKQKKRSVEVWVSTCIVTNGPPGCSALVNPSNPYLTGPAGFPYFARGGPQPSRQPGRHAHHIMGYVSSWGGMDSGDGMMFSAETVDGLVHQHGGLRLRAECGLVGTHPNAGLYVDQQAAAAFESSSSTNGTTRVKDNPQGRVKCPVGMAVVTSPGGDELRSQYDAIVHTTPPFYRYPPTRTEELDRLIGCIEDEHRERSWSRRLLSSCYRQSIELACRDRPGEDGVLQSLSRMLKPAEPELSNRRIAVPLLGAGCRGFPYDVAVEIAALESSRWLSGADGGETEEEEAIVFGLLEEKDASNLSKQIEHLLE